MLSTRPVALDSAVDGLTHPTLTTKTPARKAHKARNALQENTIRAGAKTVFSKKITHTPLRPATAHGKKPLISLSVARPLLDKTPFPNHRAHSLLNDGKTPALKLSKLALLVSPPEHDPTSPDAAPLLRPSSTRKSLRGRLSGNFKTPLTKGDYWNVSPGDLDMDGIKIGTQEAKAETEVVLVDDDDEIEYMPPTAKDVPYEPPFHMPDYTVMGRNLFQLGHGDQVDDTADVYYATDIERQIDVNTLLTEAGLAPHIAVVDTLSLPPLEDDHPFPSKSTPPPAPGPTKPTTSLTRTSSTRTKPVLAGTSAPQPAQPRAPLRTAASAAPTLAPGQTRTSALRAAKAAAASAPAPRTNPIRPASAGARPAVRAPPVTRSASSTSAAPAPKPVIRTVPGVPPRPRSTTSTSTPATLTSSRPRAGTIPTRAGKPGGTRVVKSSSAVPEDALAELLERECPFDEADSFEFEI